MSLTRTFLPSLPAAGWFQPTGLSLPPGLPFDEWSSLGAQLQAAERSLMWWIGDWVRYGEANFDDTYAQAIDELPYKYQTLADAAWVSGKFHFSRRREKCSWSHHKEVAALEPPIADRLLDEVERRNWSTRELRLEVNQLRNVVGALPAQDTCAARDLQKLTAGGRKFGTIYADPPWRYGNQATRAATGNHYETLTVDEIAALPVADLAADSAHLHLWTTNAFLFDCRAIIEAWGFEYKSCFVWVKPQMGIGNYWRVSHEFLLFATRGATPFADRSLMSWMEYPDATEPPEPGWTKCSRGRHSSKPEQVRMLIERASPVPRLELFARHCAEGWTVWGDGIERTMFDLDVQEV